MSEPFKLVGDLYPSMAYALLANETEATLVDVRTAAEWSFVGVPDLSGIRKECIFLEWHIYPSMQQNQRFTVQLRDQLDARNVSRSGALLFLCRSGVRSKSAAQAMMGLGFERSINVLGGFEGPLDGSKHRGSTNGWKAAGLPWIQS